MTTLSGLVDVEEGVRLVRAGGVIAYPTEAVFGLGCDPSDGAAVARIVALKRRPPEKGFILVASDARQLDPWLAPLEPAWRSRMDSAWPGPVTFVVPAAADTPALLRGGRTTIAVRVSDHPVVRALCEGCGHALVSTSANESGQPALRDAVSVAAAFGAASGTASVAAARTAIGDSPDAPARLDGVVVGETGGLGRPTRIVDVRTGRSLRD